MVFQWIDGFKGADPDSRSVLTDRDCFHWHTTYHTQWSAAEIINAGNFLFVCIIMGNRKATNNGRPTSDEKQIQSEETPRTESIVLHRRPMGQARSSDLRSQSTLGSEADPGLLTAWTWEISRRAATLHDTIRRLNTPFTLNKGFE